MIFAYVFMQDKGGKRVNKGKYLSPQRVGEKHNKLADSVHIIQLHPVFNNEGYN